jgi:addiction module RelE/StbE family toxin
VDYEVIISRGALRDIEHIRRYIARDNSDQAQRFCHFLLDQAERLSSSPYQGMRIKDSAEGRFLVVKSYLLVYRVVEKNRTVRVLRYWHGARDRARMNLGD